MATQAQAQITAFHLALANFTAKLDVEDKKRFAVTTLDDLHVAIEEIQQKQNSEKNLRAMSRLERFLEGMKEYDKVVSVFLNTTPILAYIWGPMKLMLQRIGERFPLLAQYEDYVRNQPRMLQLLTLILEDILNFHWRALKYFRTRMWRKIFRALWKSFDADFSAILRNLREHMTLIESQATLAQFNEVCQTREVTNRILESQKTSDTLRRREEVYRWLSAANCEADQETYTRIRQDYQGTTKWLAQKNRFRSWFDPQFCSTHLLWLNGIPGAASSIIEEARSLATVQVAFFYCRYLDPDRSTFLDAGIPDFLYDKACTSGLPSLSTESTAKELVDISIKRFPKLYLVIDGIDECERDERKQIVEFFEKIWESLPQNDVDSLRCLFVSQDDNIARNDFKNMSSLKMTESDTKGDISTYAAVRSLEIKTKHNLSDDRQRWIQAEITAKAEAQCAVSIDVADQSVDWDHKHITVEPKDLCGSLVELHNDGAVNIVHKSAKEYLVDKKVVDKGSGETSLALLCIGYLSFEGFDHNDDVDFAEFVPSGYYGFLDYAYAYWSYHLDACLRTRPSKDVVREISEAASVLIDMQWVDPPTRTKVAPSLLKRWSILEDNGNLDKLILAGYLAQRQLRVFTMQSSNDQALRLHETVAEIRMEIERVSIGPGTMPKFQLMYGTAIFKCSQVSCARFYNGFVSKQLRDEHVTKHERSFFCSFSGCAMTLLGFSTLKELYKHETDYHGTLSFDELDEPEYPELPTSFDCNQCGAKFTRKHNLKIHMRTHNAPNKKSFICSQCGKPFARLGDRTRHETITHSDAASFACGGLLKTGTPWGCNREFARRDDLKRHWKSCKNASLNQRLPVCIAAIR
ncbi:hypothetical protein T440DRAFT_490948 [Plenodomus tracheiphilus IPT5]|uniref:C2H2-type domain-containing protein n=1 Tax=Plenodomus tracheiphilus IPT5 TaxID=1408161 RepID=A0A6A7B122_9PLEO|nr:hypothetical protein T440DRAFT_490948 [Plenodomus tracheiphilus IPT5]